jgi:hypothetical protein
MAVTVEVLRPFLLEGARQEIGDLVEVSPGLAAELVGAAKARRVSAPAPTGPLTTESAEALVAGRRRKRGDPE